jgi:hypothetical protein
MTQICLLTRAWILRTITQYITQQLQVVAAVGSKKMWLYFELMICDKYGGKNTGPQCVNKKISQD